MTEIGQDLSWGGSKQLPASCFVPVGELLDSPRASRAGGSPWVPFQLGALVAAFADEPGLVRPDRVRTPKLVSSVDPENPPGARLRGNVMLTLVVKVDGKPGQIVVGQSLRPDYDEKAMGAAR